MSESLKAARLAVPGHVDILRKRAADLARMPAVDRASEAMPAVIFELADERYAIEAGIVLQVHVLHELTPLAGARPPLFGITHWRGMVLTILDLRAELGVRSTGLTDLSRVLVIDGGRQPFGILADAARDFIDLAQTTVRPLSAEEASARTLLRGITDDAVLVMDSDAVLAAGHAVAASDDMGRGG